MEMPSLLSSATSTIVNAQQKATTAANTIAKLSIDDKEVGGSKITPTSLFNPIIELKEAEMEAKTGVKVLQANQNMIGSLLDLEA